MEFCLSKDNFEERYSKGFDMAILPLTFRDAVRVTRGLGKRHLWIDSLCIIQYGDEKDDWKKESKRMESVFRNAYCTIAATSATDSSQGFLRRQPVQHETCINDFPGDVEAGVLNKRAWVLQERALSRRTIHFTSRQTYWECGIGVRCETLKRITNPKANFLGDPRFPDYFQSQRGGAQVVLLQDLFSRYTQLGLSMSTDRRVAIVGLVDRLAQAFKTSVIHGVFLNHLQRSLLWRRAGYTRLQRIPYPPDMATPSWSWMAYNGKITYMVEGYGVMQWNQGIRLTDGILSARIKSLKNFNIESNLDLTCDVFHRERMIGAGKLRFDMKDITDAKTLGCVAVGKHKMDHAVLVVASTPSVSVERREFVRVGMGRLPESLMTGMEDEGVARIM